MSLSVADQVLKGLFVAIESVRNGFSLLCAHLRPFIARRLVFVDTWRDLAVSWQYWVALGVDLDVAYIFVRLNLAWDGEVLAVSSEYDGDAQLVETLGSSMMCVFRFMKFTDSRWLTIGDSCRGLLPR